MDSMSMIRGYWDSAPDAAVSEIVDHMERNGLVFGENTSVWHEVTRYARAHDDRPACPLCGSRMDKRLSEHALCRARLDRGLPTPPLDDSITCQCARCRR